MSETVRCIIYARVSTDAQSKEDKLSIPDQVDKCVAHARVRDWSVIEVVRESHTGADLDERPQMTRIRRMVAAREADVLLVWHPDRLSRDPDHRAVLRYEFKKTKARWDAVTGHVSDGTIISNAMDYISGVGSAQELERLLSRTRPAREAKVKGDPERNIAPRPLGNQRPDYGLAWGPERKPDGRLDKLRFVEDPERADVVRWMFSAYDEGMSLRKIQAALKARGVRSPRGAHIWDVSAIRNMLQNRHYLGEGWTHTTRIDRDETGRKVQRKLPREDWVLLPEGTYPQVVESALFGRVQDRIVSNRRECPPGNRNPEVAMLRRGIGVCGNCGHALAVQWSAKGVPMYRCDVSNRDRFDCPWTAMRCGLMDDQVWHLVVNLLQTPEMLEARLFGQPQPDPTASAFPLVQESLQDLEGQRDRIRRRLRATDDDALAADYESDLKVILAAIRAAEARRLGLLAEREAWQAAQERRESILDYAAQLRTEIDGLDWHGRRNVLLRLGATVRLYPKETTGGRWDLTTRWRPSGVVAPLLDEHTGIGMATINRNGQPVTGVVLIGPDLLPHVDAEDVASMIQGLEQEREEERDELAWERWSKEQEMVNVLNSPKRTTLRPPPRGSLSPTAAGSSSPTCTTPCAPTY